MLVNIPAPWSIWVMVYHFQEVSIVPYCTQLENLSVWRPFMMSCYIFTGEASKVETLQEKRYDSIGLDRPYNMYIIPCTLQDSICSCGQHYWTCSVYCCRLVNVWSICWFPEIRHQITHSICFQFRNFPKVQLVNVSPWVLDFLLLNIWMFTPICFFFIFGITDSVFYCASDNVQI